jgi:hypothetical protein
MLLRRRVTAGKLDRRHQLAPQKHRFDPLGRSSTEPTATLLNERVELYGWVGSGLSLVYLSLLVAVSTTLEED